MSTVTIQQRFSLALEHHRAARLAEAESLYRQVLAQQPDHADALHMLGVIANEAGRHDLAVELIGRALALAPNWPAACNNLANALKGAGQLDRAIATYRRAIELDPNLAETHSNLGDALRSAGRLPESIATYRQAIAINPNCAEACNGLGIALRDNGQVEDAIAILRQCLALRPDFPQAHNNLAIALRDKGQLNEAIEAYRRAIALAPDFAEAHNNLGVALADKGQREKAIAAYHQALALRPRFPQAHSNLGNALMEKGQADDAVAAFRRAIAADPSFAEAHNNLGNALRAQGKLDDAIAALRQAVALRPQCPGFHSNLVYSMYFHPASTTRTIAAELECWNRKFGAAAHPPTGHDNDPSPDRRLRIGYLSPDFREHVVGRNLLPLLRRHDRGKFEVICYGQVVRPDAMTRQFQECADAWRGIVGLPDRQVAEQIRADRIDLLVDLTLHMANNRLLVFARKPAPVQITYLGYCGSTGMAAMDYRLSDPHLDPPDADLAGYSERTVRLPRTYWCYQPGTGFTADPAPAPALKNGWVTFGCLNNFAKVSGAALDAWARILAAVPNSRIIIHAIAGGYLQDVARRMQRAGIAQDRLCFVGHQPWSEYAQTYSRIDIALDPFPYCGGITTCDALWMGVPVVTLSGATAVGRGGRSILSNLGLPELIAFTQDQYVQIAVDLAGNAARMEELRRGMRSRMLASPLLDAGGFARDVEAAYRQMWRAWCER